VRASGKYIGVAWVFLPDVEESCREVERAVKTLGLKAVKFMGGFEGANLGAEKLWPFYDKICQLDIPILVHDTASDRDGHPNPALVGIEQLFLEGGQ
jgi:predicted TIM-barrel fold metal-dependent hydrolase